MTDNVIIGPWTKPNHPPQTIEDIERDLVQIRLMYVQELVSALAGDLFDSLETLGIDNNNDPYYTKDMAMMAESIRSYILKTSGSYHPVQQVADAMFEWTGETQLTTVKEINIKFSSQAHV